ncbi:MAG: toxin co-regulated pilus biosynthesis Q family protein, partial [Alphaproteobacteria bacterium]|nr:toxin co-regulated pilus biosynthesis Q family protein [Alphaproteobacteria bacterium]
EKAPQLFVLSLFLLGGCSENYTFWNNPTSVPEQDVVCGQNCVSEPVAVVVPSEQADNSQFVNYRRTAADYRAFGERTPQDQLIVTSGPGSNISASIPPTIDEEVADYENAVDAAFAESSDNESAGNSSGDDAVEDWLAEEGNTLKGLLSEWSERAGWRLVWNTNRNYTLAAGAMFRGRFADVASALIRNFARARPAPLATFYKGNRVLVVETMEDENAYN